MLEGVVLSDLHMFSTVSRAHEVMDTLDKPLENADILVLNGDIFDFRWSFFHSVSRTVSKAILWLEQLLTRHPGLGVHFVMGNHDCHRDFIGAAASLAHRDQRFFWHEYYFQIGNLLFTHGDCLHGLRHENGLADYRRNWGEVKNRGPAQAALYEMVHQTGIPHAAPRVYFRKQRVARGVLKYMENLDPTALAGIQHVYLGHTHVPFTDFSYNGIQFHNTGCALADKHFNPLAFTISKDKLKQERKPCRIER